MLTAVEDGQGSFTFVTEHESTWGPIERLGHYRSRLAQETAAVLLPQVFSDSADCDLIRRGIDSVNQAVSSLCDLGDRFYRFDIQKPELSRDLDVTYHTMLSQRVWARELIRSLAALPGLNAALVHFLEEMRKLLRSILSLVSRDMLALRNIRAVQETWETIRVQALRMVHRRLDEVQSKDGLEEKNRRLNADMLLRLADTVNAALENSGSVNNRPLEDYISLARQYDLLNSSARELRTGLPHEELAIEIFRFINSSTDALFLALQAADDRPLAEPYAVPAN